MLVKFSNEKQTNLNQIKMLFTAEAIDKVAMNS